MNDHSAAALYLESLGIRGVTALKLMNVLGEKAEARYSDSDGKVLATLRYHPRDFAYDRVHYADAASVIIAAGTDSRMLANELSKLPPGRYMLKGVPELIAPAVHGTIKHSLRQTIFTYVPGDELLEKTRRNGEPEPGAANTDVTGEPGVGPAGRQPAAVKKTRSVDSALLPVFAVLDYDRAGILQLIEHDGTVYFSEIDGKPASACVSFHNYGSLYEIGALATLPEYRGRGLARYIVAAAVSDLLLREKELRYNVVSTNTNSIKIAESAGLIKVLEYGHYLLEM